MAVIVSYAFRLLLVYYILPIQRTIETIALQTVDLLQVSHHCSLRAPYLLRTAGTPIDEAYLLGVLSSMPCDWQARRTVELHLTFEQLNLLTIPDPGEGHPVRDRVTELAARLAARDERLGAWAAEVGVPVGSAGDPETKADLIAELDACVAHLYGLDEDDLAVVYSTFDAKRPDRYADHHARVLAHFRRWPGPSEDCTPYGEPL